MTTFEICIKVLKMPSEKCDGRPQSGFPLKKNYNSVKWSVCDLFLCQECHKFRDDLAEANRMMSDNTASICNTVHTSGQSANTGPVPALNDCHDEMLCFMQNRCDVMAIR